MADESPSLVQCKTTAGVFVLEVRPDWSPHGAKRYLDLVSRGYYNGVYFFRKNHWIVQFGAVKHPQEGWRKKFSGLRSVPDDPPTSCGGLCTKRKLWDGALSFAGGGKDSRSDQVFIVHHLGSQPIGQSLWEVPIGNVTQGMDVVRKLYGGYGEKVDQVRIFQNGDEYIKEEFPKLDRIVKCSVMSEFYTSSKDGSCSSRTRGCEVGSQCFYPDPLLCQEGQWILDVSLYETPDGGCCPKPCSFICDKTVPLPSCDDLSTSCPSGRCIYPPAKQCAKGIWFANAEKLVVHQGKCCHALCNMVCNHAMGYAIKDSSKPCPESLCSYKGGFACKHSSSEWAYEHISRMRCSVSNCEHICERQRQPCEPESQDCPKKECRPPANRFCKSPAVWQLREPSSALYWRSDGRCCKDACPYVCTNKIFSSERANIGEESLLPDYPYGTIQGLTRSKAIVVGSAFVPVLVAIGYFLFRWITWKRVKSL